MDDPEAIAARPPRGFTVGEQPCQNFRPKGCDVPGMDGIANRHQCFHRGPSGEDCDRLVSYCLNCGWDHHDGGAETCACRLPKKERADA